jgi:hypothetical protein
MPSISGAPAHANPVSSNEKSQEIPGRTNNRIAGLVKKAFGYRNRERFKTDILFHLGGLDLYPRQ